MMSVMDAFCYSWILGVIYLIMNDIFYWRNRHVS